MTQGAYSEQPDINPAELQQIATDYGIDCGVLNEELQTIAYLVGNNKVANTNAPTTFDTKRHITHMRNTAAALSKSIGSIDHASHLSLFFNFRYKKMALRKN